MIKKENYISTYEHNRLVEEYLANGFRIVTDHSNSPGSMTGGYIVFSDEPYQLSDREEYKQDAVLQQLKGMTKEEVVTLIDNAFPQLDDQQRKIMTVFALTSWHYVRNNL